MDWSKRIIDLTVEELVTILAEQLIFKLPHEKPDPSHLTEKVVIGIKEVSDLTGLSISTIYSKVSKGLIPTVNRGKPLRFLKADVIDWVKSGMKMNQKIVEKVNQHFSKYAGK